MTSDFDTESNFEHMSSFEPQNNQDRDHDEEGDKNRKKIKRNRKKRFVNFARSFERFNTQVEKLFIGKEKINPEDIKDDSDLIEHIHNSMTDFNEDTETKEEISKIEKNAQRKNERKITF